MINFISGLLGSIIRVCYIIVGHNYFIALVLFTLFTKLILFPLMLKQLRSTKAMQRIAPEDKKLREKYKDDPQKLSQEITKLYSENKINPLGGCLLPLIQIPIILAMFWVVKQPLTYVVNMDQSQIQSYTQQYLQKDEVTEAEMKQFEITVAKEYELVEGMSIGKINLGDTPKDVFSKDESQKVSKWALLIPALTYLFAVLSNKVMQRNQQMTEDQAEMQKSMNLMMPLLSTYISFAWPMALGVYWLIGYIFSIGQQFVLDKLMEDKEDSNNSNNKKNKVLFLGKGENND